LGSFNSQVDVFHGNKGCMITIPYI